MKTLILSASPLAEASVTCRLATRLARSLFPDGEHRVVHLAEAGLPPCDGRLEVITEGENSTGYLPALRPVHDAMHWADVVIFASPVHNFTVSALLKNFIDLMVFESHRPSFMGKKALLVATAMGAGQEKLFSYLQEVVHSWGFCVVGRLGAATSMLEEPWYEAKLRAAISRLRTRVLPALAEPRPRVGLRDLIAFRVWRLVVEINRDNTPIDHAYWSERGWLDAEYYFDCRSAAPARWLAGLIAALVRYTIVHRRLRPVT
ncbi:MAG: NAD(P)H-dependent oxidoreductase [Gammaproteobacteria bacterium]|nr:NAD(P)H-dependent oxidoreductase [Gammaproteobacteria bacterium]